jgi:hypothetical protein
LTTSKKKIGEVRNQIAKISDVEAEAEAEAPEAEAPKAEAPEAEAPEAEALEAVALWKKRKRKHLKYAASASTSTLFQSCC